MSALKVHNLKAYKKIYEQTNMKSVLISDDLLRYLLGVVGLEKAISDGLTEVLELVSDVISKYPEETNCFLLAQEVHVLKHVILKL